MKKIVIIGNGISGITAARNIRKKSNDNITVISSETEYFFSRTALMYIFMGHMKFEHTQIYENEFWVKNNIQLLYNNVVSVETEKKELILNDNSICTYDSLIIASGSKPNKYNWKGKDLKGVQGMYSKQDLEMLENHSRNIKQAVIVGGGLIGIELAEMLLSRNIQVTFLVREKSFWAKILPLEESEMINKIIRSHNITLKFKTELKEIRGNEQGLVESIITNSDEEIICQFVGLTIGVSPNISFLQNSGIEIDRGVIVDEYLQTNIPDIYAIGDCVQHRKPIGGRRPVEQVWYTGKIMGETVAESICCKLHKYNPGNWFNSAKFFDLEYQTYGWVWATQKENEETFYWKHPIKNISLRLVYNKSNRNILGFNVFGIRLKHEICNAWINEKRSVDYVINNIKYANFDPEFYTRYENMIVKEFKESSKKLLSYEASI